MTIKVKFKVSVSTYLRCPLNTGIFNTVNVGKEKWDLLAIWVMEVVCLIWGLLSTGLTVSNFRKLKMDTQITLHEFHHK